MKTNICGLLLNWPTSVSNCLSVGRGPKVCKNWTSNRGDHWGRCCKKWQEKSFVSDNVCEAIAENWYAQLDNSGSTQKMKRLETTYEKYAQLLRNSFNVTYAYLITTRTKISISWGGVWCQVVYRLTIIQKNPSFNGKY